ncbi:hypothetical protein FRB94_007879 [Tulasnella sp. JGI-2019a]|nr:hypothetical protein FRB94_007879 [Tulasnella sp. JGI-2019a]
MTSGADPGLEWGAGISNYAKHLDLKYLEMNAHLPPLGPHPTYGEFDPNLLPALLVRQVYPKIYDYAKNTFLEEDFEEGRGLVVLGQPGIGKLPTASARATVDHPMDEAGKTAFLFYALVRALKDRIPVVWCRSADMSHWLQFDDEGNVARYTPSLSLRRLSFFDEIPPHDTSFMDPGFIVQVTNPQRRRYKGWAKQFDARFWVVENWSAEEVGAGARYREMSVSLVNFHFHVRFNL